MKKFIIQGIALTLIIFTSLSIATSKKTNLPFFSQKEKYFTIMINNVKIKVAVSDTDSKRQKGLGGKTSLASDSGMLFIFPKEGRYRFWMKGLSFPLDFIWLKNNEVLQINKNVPPPQKGQNEGDLPIYYPTQDVNMVLEVNGGFSDQNSIMIGDEIEIIK